MRDVAYRPFAFSTSPAFTAATNSSVIGIRASACSCTYARYAATALSACGSASTSPCLVTVIGCRMPWPFWPGLQAIS